MARRLTPVELTVGGSGSWVVQADQQGIGPLPAPVTSPSAIAACEAIGGTPTALESGSATCHNVPYLGPDGATYYVDLPLDTTGPERVDLYGTGATESECETGNYPMGGTGAAGRWDGALGLCFPPGS